MITEKKTYLCLTLGEETFAVDVNKTIEVTEIEQITEIPRTPKYIKGVINYRGEILPIIDTRQKFKLSASEKKKFLIVIFNFYRNEKNQKIGAIVDSVIDIIDYKEIDIKDVPEIGSRYNLEYIFGMILHKNDFIMILDVDKIFSVDELTLFDEKISRNKTFKTIKETINTTE